MNPWVVLTTCTVTKPSPCGISAPTGTTSRFSTTLEGFSGPALNAPLAVAIQKLTREPALKSSPWITMSAPTITGESIESTPKAGVGVGVGVPVTVLVGVRVGVAVGGLVGVGAGVRDGVGVSFAVRVGVGVTRGCW
jgi:hypothetical protein